MLCVVFLKQSLRYIKNIFRLICHLATNKEELYQPEARNHVFLHAGVRSLYLNSQRVL